MRVISLITSALLLLAVACPACADAYAEEPPDASSIADAGDEGARSPSEASVDAGPAPPTDGGSDHVLPPMRCGADGTFGRASEVTKASSGSLSDDERTLYFHRNAPSATSIFVATRAARTASFADPIEMALGPGTVRSPSIAPDGLLLYFTHETSPGSGGTIHRARRESVQDGFEDVEPLAFSGEDPHLTADERTLYFVRRTSPPSTEIVRIVVDGPVPGAPQVVLGLESPAGPVAPVLSADELVIYWATGNTTSNLDLWVASRAERKQPFERARRVAELSSEAAERPAWLSRDGCRLYFTRGNPGEELLFVAEK